MVYNYLKSNRILVQKKLHKFTSRWISLLPLWCSREANAKRINPTVRREEGKIYVFAVTFDTALPRAAKLHKNCQEEKGHGVNIRRTEEKR